MNLSSRLLPEMTEERRINTMKRHDTPLDLILPDVLYEAYTTKPAHYPGIGRCAFLLWVIFLAALPFSALALKDAPTRLAFFLLLTLVSTLFFFVVIGLRLMHLGFTASARLAFWLPSVSFPLLYSCFVLPEGYAHHRRRDAFCAWLDALLLAASIGFLALALSYSPTPSIAPLLSFAAW